MKLSSLKEIFSIKGFPLLWSAYASSYLADNIFRIAFVWLVVEQTGSPNATAIAFMAFVIPNVLTMFFSGALVDRFSRKFIILMSDISRSIVTFTLVLLLIFDILPFMVLVSIYILFGIADAFFQPAYTVIITEIVPEKKLVKANAYNGIARQTSLIIGPTFGAFLISIYNITLAFSVTAILLLISYICILSIKGYSKSQKETANESSNESFFIEIKEGLKYVISNQWLWITITVAAFANAAVSGVVDVGLPFLVRGPMDSDASTLGLIFTTIGIGALIGGIIMSNISESFIRKRGVMIYCGVGIMGIALLIMGIMPNFMVVLLAALIYGVSHQVFGVIWITTLQDSVPRQMLGRVSSVDFVGSYSLMPVGLAVVGVSISSIGTLSTFVFGGIFVLLITILGMMSSSVRTLKKSENINA